MIRYEDYAPTEKDIEAKRERGRRPNVKSRRALVQKRLAAEARAAADPDAIPEDLQAKFMSGGPIVNRPFEKFKF
jgi:hypothetical protein